MTKKTINKVQNFLTVITQDGDKVFQIVNIQLLMRRHSPHAVISFLQELRNDYSKQLKKLLKDNVSDERINDIVARNFRVKMAISEIKNYMKREDKAA